MANLALAKKKSELNLSWKEQPVLDDYMKQRSLKLNSLLTEKYYLDENYNDYYYYFHTGESNHHKDNVKTPCMMISQYHQKYLNFAL